MRVNLHDLGFDYDFLDLLPKAQATKDKIDELDFLKMKKTLFIKGARNKIIHHPKWHKMFANHVSDKGL